LSRGKATPESDIDVFLVIDDTDVKKMTRGELKEKLRAIIIGMGIDAGK
jgi:predicted nucleotidyltransferase